jgi:hypothetical protein
MYCTGWDAMAKTLMRSCGMDRNQVSNANLAKDLDAVRHGRAGAPPSITVFQGLEWLC